MHPISTEAGYGGGGTSPPPELLRGWGGHPLDWRFVISIYKKRTRARAKAKISAKISVQEEKFE
jgi:hypothetical protein